MHITDIEVGTVVVEMRPAPVADRVWARDRSSKHAVEVEPTGHDRFTLWFYVPDLNDDDRTPRVVGGVDISSEQVRDLAHGLLALIGEAPCEPK